MDITKPAVLRFGTVVLEAGALLKLTFLLFSFLRSRRWSILVSLASCRCHQLQNWWKRQTDGTSGEHELDVMRCTWTRRFWFVVFVIALYRLLQRQIVVALDQERITADFDLTILLVGIFGMVLSSFPFLINPKSQDFWYVLTMFILDATYFVPPVEVDVRDVITLSFPGRFVYAVLAKRIGCVALCILFHLLQAIQIAKQTNLSGATSSVSTLILIFFLMFLGMLIVRKLMRENVLLRVDLQKRTVELGAVSSLLTACYDAVLELDQHLKLTQDSCQLSSMLLHTAPKIGGVSGKSLLDFFAEGDRERIAEQIFSSDSDNTSVVALNADMLDSDFNHVKVEVFCARFKNLANETCFLAALREIQDVELRIQRAPAWGLPGQPGHSIADGHPLGQDLVVVYDVCTLDIQVMNEELQQLCRSYFGAEAPGYILDLASVDTQTSLCEQLQHLGNVAKNESRPSRMPVTFDFLDLGEVNAAVTIEYDHLLEDLMGSMLIHLNLGALTEANLRSLARTGPSGPGAPRPPSGPGGPGGGSGWRRSERSSRGSASSRRSSRSSRSSRASARGAISELRVPLDTVDRSKVTL